MPSQEEIESHHEAMLLDFIRGIHADSDLTALILIAMRRSPNGVIIELSCGGGIHNIYRAAATLLESVLRPGQWSASQVRGLEAERVRELAAEILTLAGASHDDVVKLSYENCLDSLKRK